METNTSSFVAYSDDNVTVSVQPLGEDAHLHCIVTNWKPSVLKRLYEVFAWLQEQLFAGGFKRMVTISPNPKFARLFGGTSLCTVHINDKRYEVIVWELQKQP